MEKPVVELDVSVSSFPYPSTSMKFATDIWEKETMEVQIEHWGWVYTLRVLKAPPLVEVQRAKPAV